MNIKKILDFLNLNDLKTDQLKIKQTNLDDGNVELLISNDISSCYLRYKKKDLTDFVLLNKNIVKGKTNEFTLNYINSMYDLQLELEDCIFSEDHIKISNRSHLYKGTIRLQELKQSLHIELTLKEFNKICDELKNKNRVELYKIFSNIDNIKCLSLSNLINYLNYSIEDNFIELTLEDMTIYFRSNNG